MLNYFKKTTISLLAVFILTAIFFSGIIDKKESYFAQASFWNMIQAWVTINPLKINVSAPAEVETNKTFKVEAKLVNKGEEKIENAGGEIFLPNELMLLKKDSIREIRVIPGKKEKKISWPIKGEKEGNYIITVSAFGELRGDSISAQDSIKVQIKESLKGTQPRQWLQNLFDFFQGLFQI